MNLAGLSIDIDSVASHLEGYGCPGARDEGAAYERAVPRALDVFARAGARATFFLIAAEAARRPDVVREIVRQGHEVGSHSMTHRLPFASLPHEVLRSEVADSRALLQALAGCPILGFRAPSWDVSPQLLEAILDAGYRYDASTYPSVLLPLLRVVVGWPNGRGRVPPRLFADVFGPTRVHRRRVNGRWLAEIPMGTAPGTRLPYYHTMRLLLPAWLFGLLHALARRRRGPVTYQFHAVDFLAVDRDALDPRIARHPGMRLGLERKLALAEQAVAELGQGRCVVTLARLAAECLSLPEAARVMGSR